VIAFKKRRRKNSRRKRGYRDEITVLRITEILTDNAKPSIGPRPKREKVAPVPAEGDDEAPKAAKKKAAPKKAAAKAATAKAAAKPRAKPDAKKAPAKKPAAKAKSDKK
jgi:large subunit ribosomal protein L21